jgi:hypothetical protein
VDESPGRRRVRGAGACGAVVPVRGVISCRLTAGGVRLRRARAARSGTAVCATCRHRAAARVPRRPGVPRRPRARPPAGAARRPPPRRSRQGSRGRARAASPGSRVRRRRRRLAQQLKLTYSLHRVARFQSVALSPLSSKPHPS